MQIITTDVAIIGSGSAGLKAYYAAKEQGAKCLLIEQVPIGPTVIRAGALSTQLLRQISLKKNRFVEKNKNETFSLYSITTAAPSNDNINVLEEIRNQKKQFIEEHIKNIYTIPEDERIMGKALFIDPNTISINDTDIQIKAKSFVIATGSEPYIPNYLKKLGNRIITSNDFFELPELPKSIAIMGTGSIGLEFGESLTRLGVKTIILGQKDFWHLSDQKVTNIAFEALSKEMFILMNSRITGIDKTDNGIEIYYLDETNHECYQEVDYILCATGRIPNLNNIRLHAAGISHDSAGIPYYNKTTMQTNVPHIFIAGDVSTTNGNLQSAITQGQIAGTNAALYPKELQSKELPRLEVVFTDPEMAIVGLNYNQIADRARNGNKFIIGEALVSKNIAAQILKQETGRVHLYFDIKTHKLLGAEICAPDAANIGQLLSSSILNNATLENLLNFTFYHPSLLEIITDACINANKKFALLPK